MRLKFPRESYIPKGAAKIEHKKLKAVVYAYVSASGKPGAVAFFGKADKPSFHYTYKSEERRSQHVSEWFKSMEERADMMAARKAKRTAFQHSLKVGDVLRSMWGYDQTNVDYYQVTAVLGKQVEIRQISCESEETMSMQGNSVPALNQFIGEPMRKLVQEGNAVRIASYACAYPLEPVANIGGKPVYKASHWTAYA